MAQEAHVRVDGSERAALPGAVLEGPANPDEQVQVTIVLRRRLDSTLADLLRRVDRVLWRVPRLNREELATLHGADPTDMERVVALAAQRGLQVLSADPLTREVKVSGSVAELQSLFDTELGVYRHPGGTYRGRIGAVRVPAEIADAVQAVLGLDDRPQAQPHIALAGPSADPAATPAVVRSLSPAQVAQLYNFPTGVTGQGQTIAIIELGGGYRTSDIEAFFTRAGLPPPVVTTVSVDGGQNAPTTPPGGADIETALDIQVAGGVAPATHIVVYFAPNTDRGFIDAITTAVHDTTNHPSVISISWGSAELNWTQQAMQAMEQVFVDAAALGITVCVASGDNGSADATRDGLAHADFPASAPHALGCGGTTLDASGTTINSEIVWNSGGGATGGGVSDVFDLPAYQTGVGVPPSANPNRHVGRGVPDVSGDADPASGYQIVVGGNWMSIGGTSAVAPLWSGLTALMNQSLGTSVGFLQPFVYTPTVRRTCFRDITSGNNGAYRAAAGWDPCTGLGSPSGQQLLSAFSIGLGDHFYTVSSSERDAAVNQYGYLSAGVAGYVAAATSTVPLYRLASDHHFYTTSLTERDAAVSQYGLRAEGVAAWVFQTQADSTTPLYRLANFGNGDHFYTTLADERDAAIAQYGYQSEGVACYAFGSAAPENTPVYRLVNNVIADHFYTTSETERDTAIAQYGYQSEGIAFYSARTPASVPLYRLANGHHWYTTDLTERDTALAAGQRAEDLACFVSPTQIAGTRPFYRLVNPVNGARLYTLSDAERDTAVSNLGYQLEGICCFLFADEAPALAPLFRLLRTDTR
jgi:kumamolisin